MKKWMYVIFPTIGLGLFLILYFAEVKKLDEKEQAHAVEVAQLKKADDERKAKLQDEANASAAKKAKERDDERTRKEAEKAAKWKAEGDKIQEDTDKYKADAAAATKKIADLEAQIEKLRTQRDQANRDYLAAVKAVELGKIERRNAEIEIQRTTKMLVTRAEDSSFAKMPPPFVPPVAR
jgi:uncharacterized coiled-coil DUF342 family protein